MKKQILFLNIVSTFLFSFSYSKDVPSLKSQATQYIIKQILNYPTLTPQQKESFNKSGLDSGPVAGLISFKNQKFDYFNFSGIRLLGVDFEGAHFNGVNFRCADLRYCNFKGATFKNTNLKDSILIGINFEECNFKGASLEGAMITETLRLPTDSDPNEILKDYDKLLKEGDTQNIKVINSLIGTGSFRFGRKVENLNLSGINFRNCNLYGIEFQKCTLTNAEFGNTTLWNFKLKDVQLAENFKLSGEYTPESLIRFYADPKTTQEQKNLLNNFLGSGITLESVHLDNLDLTGINLNRVTLGGHYKRGVCSFTGSTLIGSNFTHAKTTYYDSEYHNKYEPNFEGAIFVGGSRIPCYGEYDVNHLYLLKKYLYSNNTLEKENIKAFINFFPLDLEKKDLSKLDLRGLPLEKFNLKDAQLQGAILWDGFAVPDYGRHSDLVEHYSKFSKDRDNLNRFFDIYPLNLSNSDLGGLHLQGIHLNNAYLHNVTFWKTHLKDAFLKKFKFSIGHRGVMLEGTTLPDGTLIDYCHIEEGFVQMYGAAKDPEERQKLNKIFNIMNITIDEKNVAYRNRDKDNKYTKLQKADLFEINLSHIHVEGGDYQGTIFRNADLSHAFFRNADLRDADFTGANLTGASFMNCKLGGAHFFDGFSLPDYKSDEDLVRFYSEHKSPKIRQDLNKCFDFIYLEIKNCENVCGDLRGINFTKVFGSYEFKYADLTDAITPYGIK